MRLGVLDDHVMVRELIVLGQVKAIENALHAFAARSVRMLLRDSRAPRAKECAMKLLFRAQLRVEGRQVKGRRAFVLKLAVLDVAPSPTIISVTALVRCALAVG